MLTHEEMIGLQAEKHDLIDPIDFESREKYVFSTRFSGILQ